ncbi:aldo/keto reductase [Mediterraneibacter glycyrrhizinilyticus]|nr:aldo/keto reductase [Mediterraneibacter glycyrrhizinilyticus]
MSMAIENAKAAFQRSLERLKTDYLDMYLIHCPLPDPEYSEWKELDAETWRALEDTMPQTGWSGEYPDRIRARYEDMK